MCGADCVGTHFTHAEVLYLAFLDEVGDGTRNVLDRNGRVESVLVEEIDGLNAEVFQGLFTDTTDVFRAAVKASFDFLFVLIEHEAELGGDLNAVLKRRDRLSHEFFVLGAHAAVDLGGIKEVDAEIVGLGHHAFEHGRIGCFAAVIAHAHTAEAKSRDVHGRGT